MIERAVRGLLPTGAVTALMAGVYTPILTVIGSVVIITLLVLVLSTIANRNAAVLEAFRCGYVAGRERTARRGTTGRS